MKLSVIIVNYNVEYFLEQCLHSVRGALEGIPSEIFVVDNNSVDGSVRMLKEKFPEVKLVLNENNSGFSYANNQALKLSQGEYVLLLNPDTLVSENTFQKCIGFMDRHPEAGALGVKMIDGKGVFLPESKRGFPTPSVAFYKIFGLSSLFPRSRAFGRYHLGFLDRNKIHEVDVLAGAFMFIRRSVLNKTGLLDESFFMYGEDIDLSYRIKQAGYKNYYFPETSIIHYKGESTKKSSINYVFIFYHAMIIFARKHFSKKNARTFAFLINLAIYIRALAAISGRFISRMFLPALDFAVLFTGIYLIKNYYEQYVKFPEGGSYPEIFTGLIVPCYILIWQLFIFLSGGYETPVRIFRIIKGVLIGTGVILIVYALLPETWRFSRALILLGSLWACIILPLLRYILHVAGVKTSILSNGNEKRILIIGTEDECKRVDQLLNKTAVKIGFLGYAGVEDREFIDAKFIGKLSQLPEIVNVHKLHELIFCARDVSAQSIISQMTAMSGFNVDFKIAPPESLSVIGSNSINTSGDLYVIGTNSISRTINRRNKRMLDILVSVVLLGFSPILFISIKNPLRFLKNCFLVAGNFHSWVGYDPVLPVSSNGSVNLPPLKKGILYPSDFLRGQDIPAEAILQLNLKYVKDYDVWRDFYTIVRNIPHLGRHVKA